MSHIFTLRVHYFYHHKCLLPGVASLFVSKSYLKSVEAQSAWEQKQYAAYVLRLLDFKAGYQRAQRHSFAVTVRPICHNTLNQ